MIENTLQRPIEGTFKRLAQFNKNRAVDVYECTSCGTRLESSETDCPNCTSEIRRTKTVVPHVFFNLVVVLIRTGLGVLRRVATGKIETE
jgi:DNA-directed RNA polymerase subunit RPC12/RpoP